MGYVFAEIWPVVVVAQGAGVVALDHTGAQLWSVDLDDPVDHVVATATTVVVYDQEGQLIGLDLSDGSTAWSQRQPQSQFRDGTALGTDHVALVGPRGVTILDVRSGRTTATLGGVQNLVVPLPQAHGSAPAAVAISDTSWLTFSVTGAILARDTVAGGFGSARGVLRTDGHTVAVANQGRMLFWGAPVR